MNAGSLFLSALSVLIPTLLTNCSRQSERKDASLPSSQESRTNPTETPVEATAPHLFLPLGNDDPAFVVFWKELLVQQEGSDTSGPLFSDASLRDKTPPPQRAWVSKGESELGAGWRIPHAQWIQEVGSIYRLVLSPGLGTQDPWIWTRVLREAQSLIETPEPSFPFRPSLKLVASQDEAIPRAVPLSTGDYVDVQSSRQASPLARETCETFRRWFSTRQLLSGRNVKAQGRNKEALVLFCDLLRPDQETRGPPYLQLTELALPIQDPKRKDILFRTPADLQRWDRLNRLPEL
jgi:hypothetical protein